MPKNSVKLFMSNIPSRHFQANVSCTGWDDTMKTWSWVKLHHNDCQVLIRTDLAHEPQLKDESQLEKAKSLWSTPHYNYEHRGSFLLSRMRPVVHQYQSTRWLEYMLERGSLESRQLFDEGMLHHVYPTSTMAKTLTLVSMAQSSNTGVKIDPAMESVAK